MKYLLLSVALGIINIGHTQSIYGHWKGIIQYEQVEVPFIFEVEKNEQGVTVTLINGAEKLVCKSSELRNDSLFVRISPFDVLLKAKVIGQVMTGEWKKGYRRNGIAFEAMKGKSRFEIPVIQKSVSDSQWELTFESPGAQSDGVGIFTISKGLAYGTILTTTGDYRYMSGVYRNDSLVLSSFDGAHAFLLEAKVDGKSLTGVFHMDNGYTEEVKGYLNAEATLPDPFKMVEGGLRPYFDILSAGNPSTKVDKDKYFDKILILQLFGTWCPNSMDQSHFLREWYKTKPESVEVLAVTYEPNFSTTYGNQRIEAYRQSMNLPYDIKLGGKLSKGQAALSLPHTTKINAFPTLILVDKAGFIRYEFDYFNGPATGVYYEKFIQQFSKAIATLLAE